MRLGSVVARKQSEEFGVSAYGLKLYGRGEKSAYKAAILAKLLVIAFIVGLMIISALRLFIFP
jgi:hypothetical protein